jgi:hypothetical protein
VIITSTPGRGPSILEGFSSSDLSFHSLGGRDVADPLSKITVALSPKGWHCPECLHVSTTKGNLVRAGADVMIF